MDEQPLRRQWTPTNEAALRAAYDQGLLEERNWCELKSSIGSTAGASAELGRDLASLAVDGGNYIAGLNEEAPEGNPLSPVELDGLAERIEQVAATRVHPPLLVDSTTIQAEGKLGFGYLIVHVPASPLAPHQVDGVYYGRGDKTKRRLTDAEVERLFARRATWAAGAGEALDRLMNQKDAHTETQATQLYLAARPAAASPQMFQSVVGITAWRARMVELQQQFDKDERRRTTLQNAIPHGFHSSVLNLTDMATSPGGVRTRESRLGDGGIKRYTELDIHEDGVVWFSMDELSQTQQDNAFSYVEMYIDAYALAIAEVLTVLKVLSNLAGYASVWDVSCILTNMRGKRPALAYPKPNMISNGLLPAYESDAYSAATRTNTNELDQKLPIVVERIAGRLIRSVGMETGLAGFIVDPTTS